MRMLVFPFGRKSYLSKTKNWENVVASEIKEVEELMKYAKFSYFACGNQEVYEVSEEGIIIYESLKSKLKSWISSPDPTKYQMSREVTTW